MSVAVVEPRPADFDDLYARFGPTIYARCRQILRDPAAAEDATQEVFFKIHHQLARIGSQREALGWLYRTATNHCLNEIRNGRTRALLMQSVPVVEEADEELRIWQRDLMLRVVRGLPEELTLAGWLYHVDGLEQAEIAEIARVSRRTVISRLKRFAERARAFLRKERA